MSDPGVTVTHLDLSQNRVAIGDFVVYSALWDRSAVLKFGKVVALKTRKHSWKDETIPTVGVVTVDRVGWKKPTEWELQNKGKQITLGYLDRLLVVPRLFVPADARKLLDEATRDPDTKYTFCSCCGDVPTPHECPTVLF